MSSTAIPPTALLAPILDGGIRSVNFFNGRLLSGEDLSAEQRANRDERRRLGQALGDGIAYGLEVAPALGQSAPIVTVRPGLALNRRGQTLTLATPVDLSLVDLPATSTATPAAGFADCETLPTGGYNPSGTGFYLLVLAPTETAEGRAPSSGLGNVASTCNTRYRVGAVQFRVVPLDELAGDAAGTDRHRARNRIAYRCFGYAPPANVGPLQGFGRNPFGPDLIAINDELATARPDLPAYGPIDDLRPHRLTDCDVPLALIFATPGGIQYVDTWSVRRRVTAPSAQGHWAPLLNDRRRAEAEASLLQFQEQLDWGAAQTPPLTSAGQLTFLPPSGFLPTPTGDTTAWKTFLGDHAPPAETVVDEGLLRGVLARALTTDPIVVGQTPLAAVAVYRAHTQPNFVLFARAEHGRVKVTFNPAPLANRAIQVNADGPAGSRVATGAGVQSIAIDRVPAGSYQIRATVTGYQDAHADNVAVRAGQITGVTIALKQPVVVDPGPVKGDKRHQVPLGRWRIKGVDDPLIAKLEKAHIYTVADLATAEPQYVADVLGHTPEYGRALIGDASDALREIKEKRAYYEGIDNETRAALDKLGLTDDIALANADHALLAREVGAGFATRLIEQAREIVPATHWQLDQLGLDAGQIEGLQRLGITSKGALAARAATAGDRDTLGAAIGTNAAFVDTLRASATTQLTTSSLDLARNHDLGQLPGVNDVIASKLANANLSSLDEIAAATTDDLVRATGLSTAAVDSLKTEATKGARQSLDVGKLASLSNETAAALKGIGVNTVGDLLSRNPADIGAAFGGDAQVAAAIINGAKLGIGLH